MKYDRRNYQDLKEHREYLLARKKCGASTVNLYRIYGQIIMNWAGTRTLGQSPKFPISFPDYLASLKDEDGNPYSYSYMKAACAYLRRFLTWARDHKEAYKSITSDWIEDIIPAKKIGEVKEIVYYTLDEVKRICALTPENRRQQRAIAALAFLMLTGMRISAFLTLPIKNVIFEGGKIRVLQTPKDGVCTKNNKAACTSTFTCGALMEIVKKWDDLVRSSCPETTSWYARLNRCGEINPREIIPMTMENMDELKAKARSPYKNFRQDLKEICELAGVEYKSPHKARYGHIHVCMSKAVTMEERKAVSVNAMHGSMAITDEIYARMSHSQTEDILSGFNMDEPKESNASVTPPAIPANLDKVTMLKYLSGFINAELEKES